MNFLDLIGKKVVAFRGYELRKGERQLTLISAGQDVVFTCKILPSGSSGWWVLTCGSVSIAMAYTTIITSQHQPSSLVAMVM